MQLGPDTPAAEQQDTSLDTAQSSTEGDLSAQTGTGVEPGGVQGWLDQFRAENSMLPNILIIGAMVLLVILVMRSLHRTSRANKRRSNAMGTPSERIAELHEQAHQSMEPSRKLMVDAEDIARRLGAALDNKAARLELLIEEADAKLDQLNRAMARQPERQRSPDSGPAGETASTTSNTGRTLDPSLLDRARVEQDIEDRQSRVAGRIAPAETTTVDRPEPESVPEISISDQIHALAQSGKSSRDIATELQQPIGQVELILNLRKRAEHS